MTTSRANTPAERLAVCALERAAALYGESAALLYDGQPNAARSTAGRARLMADQVGRILRGPPTAPLTGMLERLEQLDRRCARLGEAIEAAEVERLGELRYDLAEARRDRDRLWRACADLVALSDVGSLDDTRLGTPLFTRERAR